MVPGRSSPAACPVTPVVTGAVPRRSLASVPVVRQVVREIAVPKAAHGAPAKGADGRRAAVRVRLVVPAMDAR